MKCPLSSRKLVRAAATLAVIAPLAATGAAHANSFPEGFPAQVSASCNNLKLVFDMKRQRFKLYAIGQPYATADGPREFQEIAQGRLDQTGQGPTYKDIWGELDGNANRRNVRNHPWIGYLGIRTALNPKRGTYSSSIGFTAPFGTVRQFKLCDATSNLEPSEEGRRLRPFVRTPSSR